MIGVSHLGMALTITVNIVLLYAFSVFLIRHDRYSSPALSSAAWGILIVTVLTAEIATAKRTEPLPDWSFWAYLAALTVVVALDVAGAWGASTRFAYPTAAAATGAALLVAALSRRTRDILAPTAVLAITLAVTLSSSARTDILTLASDIMVLAFSLAPPLLGAGIVHAFRVLIMLEADRVQVQSTITAPAFTVGLHASEELARLDLDAERLLQAVASGSAPLPLGADQTAAAATLATKLRSHLIEGRRQTWLYHAIAESAFLGPAVQLSDPHDLAVLLSPAQRDGLLSAVWLLISEPIKPGQAVQLVIGASLTGRARRRRGHLVPITIATTGVPRKSVDPAIWEAVRRVGSFTETPRGTNFGITIECRVGNPVDQ